MKKPTPESKGSKGKMPPGKVPAGKKPMPFSKGGKVKKGC